ncbi:MAG: DinB family protein [Acidobacteriota bacterium]|nr:DinB family protein [Acidobacteriota bacterium]
MPQPPAQEFSLDATEREVVVLSLQSSRLRLLEVVAPFTPEQRAFQPAEDRWSVAACIEHVTLVETLVLNSIEQQLAAPPTPDKAEPARGKEKLISRLVPERGTRVKAPERAAPTGRWPDFDQLLGEFEKARERSLRFASTTRADLRSHFFPHFAFGDLDCYQWLLFLGAHCERHVRQIEELQADPGFPVASKLHLIPQPFQHP